MKPRKKSSAKRYARGVPDWEDETAKGRMKEIAYSAIVEWLSLKSDEERRAKISLLCVGLPSGSIKTAQQINGLPIFAVAVDHKDWNTPRLLDAPTLALVRLLTAFDGRLRMNDRRAKDIQKAKGPRHFFPAVVLRVPNHNIGIHRLAWGVDSNAQVKQLNPKSAISGVAELGTHYDWTLGNMHSKDAGEGTAVGRRFRSAVVKAALVYRRERQEQRVNEPSRNRKKLMLCPSATDYKAAIERCFELLDGIKQEVLHSRVEGASN